MAKKPKEIVKLSEVHPIFKPHRNTVVFIEPNLMGLIGGLFLTLLVMCIFVFFHFTGVSISLSSFLFISAITFVISYGAIGFLTYYALLVIRREHNPEPKKSQEVSPQGEVKPE